MMRLTHTLTLPVPGGTVPRLEHVPPSRVEWDFLLEERLAIMHESGMTTARAQALALADTHRAHGDRPRGDA